MIDQAIKKIEDEMTASNGDSYVQAVGGFLLQYVKNNPGTADKVLAEDKSIKKSLDEMRKVAQEKQVGNVAVLSDQEGFAVVLEYFGVEGKPQQAVEPAPSSDFEISLDDLLGG